MIKSMSIGSYQLVVVVVVVRLFLQFVDNQYTYSNSISLMMMSIESYQVVIVAQHHVLRQSIQPDFDVDDVFDDGDWIAVTCGCFFSTTSSKSSSSSSSRSFDDDNND